MNGPDPALFVFSQALPKSPSFSWLITTFFSTTPPTAALRQYSRKVGAFGSAMSISSVCGSVARMRSATLSLSKPSCAMMKAGALFMMTARCRLNAASSAVTGAPLPNLRSARILKVHFLPSGLVVQLSASVGTISVGFWSSGVTSFS